MEQHLTVSEVASLLRVSRWSVGRYIKSGALMATKADGPNGAVRIPLSSYVAYIDDHTVTPQQETQ
ncbi:helix-turn-helix domain-containing protein [Salinispora arenicola]|uniref:helix-turn-helix domain-containing protein n=1 Tax=Salinispora arenicola TaxID=168697 RepID=UPI00036CCA38|nr:helix-turn-helix domain-containing protein [Salinispora arenicola]